MRINIEPYGRITTGEASLFTLTNDSGSHVKITNYGGIVTDVLVPDRDGKLINVVLGFDKLEDYLSDSYFEVMPYFGAIIGRYANRINKGRFVIDGVSYQIPQNLGENALHGGIQGFDKKLWASHTVTSDDHVALTLSYLSPHMEEGFPGNLHVQVRYSWNNQNELHIEYEAETDAPTHINLTNHTYFNLNGCLTDVRSHEVIIHADAYTEVDSLAIPTGRLLPVDNTWLDFRKGRLIGEQIDRAKPYGYDHNLLINNFDGTLRPAARASDQTTGIVLETETTEPGMQFYTANHLDSSLSRGETKFSKRMGFCFETQHYPDSPNRPEFPSTLLKPGEKYHSQTIYRFSNLID